MTTRRTMAAAVLVVGTALGGCGGGDRPDASRTPSPALSTAATGGAAEGAAGAATEAASVLPGDLARATSGDTDLDGRADPGAAVTAAEFCGFLADETPKVIDLRPAEYAYATFGGDLFTFYTDQGLLTDIDGAAMDALAATACPEAAADLLPALGATSFERLLSQ